MSQEEIEQYLTVRNYKEPLKPIPKNRGFGFYGTIKQTMDGDKLQCHICGILCRSLAAHVTQKHRVLVKDYRDTFQLAAETALVSDTLREEKKQITIKWRDSRTKKEKIFWEKKRLLAMKKVNDRRRDGSFRVRAQSLETQNKRGSCPDQILAKISEITERMGRTPSLEEFVKECGSQRYRYLITKVYGSWLNALKLLKLQPKGHYSLGRAPKYSDKELLTYLENFAKENHKVPTYTDFKRNYLPSFSVYTWRFGSIEEARKLAGVYKYVTKEQVNKVHKFARNVRTR